MLAIKHTLPKVCTQLSRPCVQRFNQIRTNVSSTTPTQSADEKPTTAHFDGILSVLGQSKQEGGSERNTSSVLNQFSNINNKQKSSRRGGGSGSEGGAVNNSFSFDLSSIATMGQAPHQLHINATFNNTIITLTRPNGAPLVTTSGGSAGFKKAARSGYEAAHQAAIQLLDKMNAKNLQVPNIHIVLKGFGPGRDAAFKALVGGSQWNVKRITDATPIPFGGCRPKKARRL
jgi:small subunit ribosomal protein S11